VENRLFGRAIARVVTEEELTAVFGGAGTHTAHCTSTDNGHDEQCDDDTDAGPPIPPLRL
jgi:hypothetical protein